MKTGVVDSASGTQCQNHSLAILLRSPSSFDKEEEMSGKAVRFLRNCLQWLIRIVTQSRSPATCRDMFTPFQSPSFMIGDLPTLAFIFSVVLSSSQTQLATLFILRSANMIPGIGDQKSGSLHSV